MIEALRFSHFFKTPIFRGSRPTLRIFNRLLYFLFFFCTLTLLASDGSTDYFLNTSYHDFQGKNVICFGDSITYGIGASHGHDYPSLLGQALGVKVINAGVDGDNTEDALKRLETDVLSKNPGLVVILLGGNDYLDRIPLSKTFENLDIIIRRIRATGASVVVVEIGASILGKPVQNRWDKLVMENQVPFVSYILSSYFFDRELKSDNLHPNDMGYEIVAGRILQVVKPILKHNS